MKSNTILMLFLKIFVFYKRKEEKMKSIDIDMKKVKEFLDAAINSTRDSDYSEFECPLCGETAKAIKASINGHAHAACEGCGMSFMQ